MNETKYNCENINGETLMSYIYGELEHSDAAFVEDHLVECEPCTTEFAQLSESRLSVFEWNKLEFEPLSTPAINIEFTKKRGVIAAFAEAVAGKWRITVPAFAAFVMAVSGFAIYSGIFSNNAELAKEQPKISVSTAERSAKEIVISESPDQPETAEIRIDAEVPALQDSSAEKAQAVAVSDRSAPKRVQPKRIARPIRNEPLPNAMTVADVPIRLSDLEESVDNSPRLADLFDDIEAS